MGVEPKRGIEFALTAPPPKPALPWTVALGCPRGRRSETSRSTNQRAEPSASNT